MLDTELLRAVCREIAVENDSARLQDLLSFLCAVVDDDHQEMRDRLLQISDNYSSLKKFVNDSPPPRLSLQRGPRIIRRRGRKSIS